tara:strand:+ start:91 stop:3396 length:3306 start_codon:yes stop_codon:yes gene_type:complete
MANPLMAIVQDAIGEGKLRPENYRDAIRVSRDPEVAEYLEGLLDLQDVPTITDKVLDEETLELIDRPVQGNANPRSVRPVTTTDQPTSKGSNPRASSLNRDVVEDQEAQEEEVTSKPVYATPAAAFAARREEQRVVESEAEIAARTTEEGRALTLEEIRRSPFLRESGILAGDLVKDNKIIRVYSTVEDAKLGGKILTQADIDASPYLTKNNVSAGSRVIDKTIFDTKKGDAWLQFKYAMDQDEKPVERLGNILETYFPFKATAALSAGRPHYMAGNDWAAELQTSDERYEVEGFSEMSPDQRRQSMQLKRDRALAEKYGQFFEEAPDSKAAMLGVGLNQASDVTSFAGLGKTLPQMAVRGAGLFGSLSALEDYSNTGEVNPKKAAAMAAAGLVLVPGLGWVGQKITSRAVSKSANKMVDKAQAQLDVGLADGLPMDNPQLILSDAGINPQAVAEALKQTNRKLRIHGSASSAMRAAEKAMTQDSSVQRQYSEALDNLLGIMATQLRNQDEGIAGRLAATEFRMSSNTMSSIKKVEPFLKGLSEVPKSLKAQISKHLSNGSFKIATDLMAKSSPVLARNFTDTVVPLLDDLGKQLKETGHSFDILKNYFPRNVKDYRGLRNNLGLDFKGLITKQIANAEKAKGRGLGNLEKEDIIERVLQGYRYSGKGKPSFAKERQLTLTDDNMAFYASPEEALSMYIRRAVNDIEKSKFFGRTLSKTDDGLIDVDQSVSSYIRQTMAKTKIDPDKEDKLVELLKARFVEGEQTAGKLNSTIKDLGYMGTIANPYSAITQLADVSVAASFKGLRNSLGSMFGTKDIKLMDIGLDQLAIELTNGDLRTTAKLLDKAMGLSGFKWADRLGKETYINAAFKHAKGLVKTKKGEAAFRKEHGKFYGDEIDSLVADLKTGQITPNVKMFAFNELAEVQPITLSQMPVSYLRNPSNRILYMLKSFTLKQVDLVRKKIVGEYKKGNKVQAVKNAALFAGYLTAANTGTSLVKDILRGREIEPDEIPSRSLWALLGVFGFSKYNAEQYFAKGDAVGGVINMVAPAAPLINAAFSGVIELGKEEPEFEALLKPVPVVGDITYNWLLGGAEKYNDKQLLK